MSRHNRVCDECSAGDLCCMIGDLCPGCEEMRLQNEISALSLENRRFRFGLGDALSALTEGPEVALVDPSYSPTKHAIRSIGEALFPEEEEATDECGCGVTSLPAYAGEIHTCSFAKGGNDAKDEWRRIENNLRLEIEDINHDRTLLIEANELLKAENKQFKEAYFACRQYIAQMAGAVFRLEQDADDECDEILKKNDEEY